MRTSLLLAALALCAGAADGPMADSANFTVDQQCVPDMRPGTTGTTAGLTSWRMTFNPPQGTRVRIVHLSGDLVAWPLTKSGGHSGVLLSFQTTAPQGSIRCDPCASNTLLYIQDVVGGVRDGVRAPFSEDVKANGLLQPDNTLVIVVSAWLNTTGGAIHMEPTFTVTYRYEKAE